MKRLFLVLAVPMLSAVGLSAEEPVSEEKVDATMSVDFVSSYIWRGQDLGHASIQPGAGISYKGFSLGAWGSSSFDKDETKEVDITLSYGWNGLTLGVTDYWFDNGPGYFHYKAHDTAHVFEANVGYDFGPVALNWYTNFAGNDGVTSKGKRAYSSYVEVSAPFTLGGLDWGAEVGATPYATSSYNAHGFAVINIGLQVGKGFTISDDFGINVFVKGICNPRDDKGYLLAGVSFSKL